MADDITPGTPAEQSATSTVAIAENYIKEELAAARGTLRNTQIFGSIIVIALSVYLISITTRFTNELQPDTAVKTVQGFITGQIQETGDAFLAQIGPTVTGIVEKAPDAVIKELPAVRKTAVDTFRTKMEEYTAASADKLSENLDQYIAENKESIKAVLDTAKDEKALAELQPTLHGEVLAYLSEPQESGKSIKDDIDESLEMLTDAQRTIHRLATSKALSPSEKKARRALAIIANTVDTAGIEPIDLKAMLDEVSSGSGDEAAAEQPAAKPAAKPVKPEADAAPTAPPRRRPGTGQ